MSYHIILYIILYIYILIILYIVYIYIKLYIYIFIIEMDIQHYSPEAKYSTPPVSPDEARFVPNPPGGPQAPALRCTLPVSSVAVSSSASGRGVIFSSPEIGVGWDLFI